MKTSQEIDAIAAAIVSVQANVEPAPKDATNPHFRSRYATLNSVWDVVRPLLARAGLAVVQMPTTAEPGTVGLTTRLIHAESGQWIESEVSAPLAKADAQGVGSAITYLRRYSLSAALGVVADEDDDANAAATAPQAARAPRTLAELAAKRPAAAAPQPAAAAPQPAAAAPVTDGEWQTFRIQKVFRDEKESVKADGTVRRFTKYSALTDGGLRLTTLKLDLGGLLRDGITVNAVIDPVEKYRAHEILALRVVEEGGSLDDIDWDTGTED